MSNRFYIHIGLPKTATTSLQDNVFALHEELNFLGKTGTRNCPAWNITRQAQDLYRDIWRQPPGEFDEARAAEGFDACLKPHVSSGKPNVISLEEFSHATAQRFEVPRRLGKLFPGAGIILTTRSQPQAVASAYFEKYLNFEVNIPFDAWFQRMAEHAHEPTSPLNQPLHLHKFGTLAKAYAEVFGCENIMVLPLELLIRDRRKYAERLGTFLGINIERTFELLSKPNRNTRMSMPAIRYQRAIKKLSLRMSKLIPQPLRPRLKYLRGQRGGLINGPITFALNKLYPAAQHELNEQQKGFLHNYYRRENKLLAEMFDLDLQSLGYPM